MILISTQISLTRLLSGKTFALYHKRSLGRLNIAHNIRTWWRFLIGRYELLPVRADTEPEDNIKDDDQEERNHVGERDWIGETSIDDEEQWEDDSSKEVKGKEPNGGKKEFIVFSGHNVE